MNTPLNLSNEMIFIIFFGLLILGVLCSILFCEALKAKRKKREARQRQEHEARRIASLGPILKIKGSAPPLSHESLVNLNLEARVKKEDPHFFEVLLLDISGTGNFELRFSSRDWPEGLHETVNGMVSYWHETCSLKTPLGKEIFRSEGDLRVVFFANALWLIKREAKHMGRRGPHIHCKVFLLYSPAQGAKNTVNRECVELLAFSAITEIDS